MSSSSNYPFFLAGMFPPACLLALLPCPFSGCASRDASACQLEFCKLRRAGRRFIKGRGRRRGASRGGKPAWKRFQSSTRSACYREEGAAKA
eukprot:753382-Hanusia_phi.AAC.2